MVIQEWIGKFDGPVKCGKVNDPRNDPVVLRKQPAVRFLIISF